MSDSDDGLEGAIHRYWDSFVGAVVRSDEHTVELVPGDPHGINIAVDGVHMFDGSGYSEETFAVGMDYEYREHVTDEAIEKMKEVYQNAD